MEVLPGGGLTGRLFWHDFMLELPRDSIQDVLGHHLAKRFREERAVLVRSNETSDDDTVSLREESVEGE